MQGVQTHGVPRSCPAHLPHTSAKPTAQCSSSSSHSSSLYLTRTHRWQPRDALLSGGAVTSRSRVSSSQLVRAEATTTVPLQAPPAPEKVPVDGVQTLRLTEHTTLLRGVCNQRFKFEVEYGLKRGTSDNCYVTRGKQDAVLIDVPDEAWLDDFVPALEGVVPVKQLTHIIVSHLSPKRVGSLRRLLELRQGRPATTPLQLLLSNPALQLLRATLGKDEAGAALLSTVTLTVVKSDSCIELDSGALLRLIPCPTPRWPDLLAISSDADQILFSSKLFAAHVAPTAANVPGGVPWDEGGWDVYGHDWQHYYDCMLAPVARQAVGVLERLESLMLPAAGATSVFLNAFNRMQVEFQKALTTALPSLESPTGGQRIVVSAIAPMHGPVVRTSVVELLRQYSAWTVEQIAAADVCTVVVMYASAYGNTAALAQALSRGITKAGVGVETLNLEQCGMEEVQEAISRCSGFVIGSPTLGGHMPTQVKTALGAVLRESEAKALPCGVFGSFGWSGEAVDEMEARLRDAGFKFGFDAIRVKFKPTAGQLQVCEESGTDLAQMVRKKLKRQQSQAATSQASTNAASSLEQAMGRVLGSLCVLSSKDGDAESGMLASWISQASFDPPGLSIAVKKDRAVENLMLVGNRFNINILKEGGDKAIMKQMLKPFKPAEPRFEGLNTQVSEETGAVILMDSAAYLECTVKDRLEAGDHWVVYGVVDGGKVLDEGALAAIHQRKSGTSY